MAQGADGARIDAAPGPGQDERCENQQEPTQRVRRKRIEPGQKAHQQVVQRAHFTTERHGQQHCGCAGDEGNEGLGAGRICVRRGFRNGRIGAGKDRIVAGGANGLDEGRGSGNGGIEDDDRAIGH